MTTLVVTNDFPPRIGGIESFVTECCRFLDDDVVVLTSTAPGSAAWDAAAGHPIERLPGPLLPTPAVGRAAVELLRRHGADRVLFGAAAPLALLAPTLRAAGAARIVALTHGHETWWAALPGSRALLRRIGAEVDVLTTISDYVSERVGRVLTPAARDRRVRLPPPVDLDFFRPAAPSADSRFPSLDGERRSGDLGVPRKPSNDGKRSAGTPNPPPQLATDHPQRVIGVGRMVRRKGFDTLLDAWSLLAQDRTVPTTTTTTATTNAYELVLVGDGPERRRLERQAAAFHRRLDPRRTVSFTVSFTGALDRAGVRAELQRSHVFAFPVRTRLGGLDPEGLGLATLEAAACGLPVVVGRSGGAPETVEHGHTGHLVDPDDPDELATRLADLLRDPARARQLGAAGRQLVAERYGADQARRVLRTALGLPVDTV